MVNNKVIMMQSDLFMVRIVQQTIFWQQTKLFSLKKFDWLEPVAGLFHLQINLLLILFNKLWGKPKALHH